MLSFIDLFAGIGGFRRGFERAGSRCVFSCEIDKFSRKTYLANFPTDHPFAVDICDVRSSDLPAYDVLLAGFPCQPFSRAGNLLAMDDPRAYCVGEMMRIIEETRPKVFVLENVPGLLCVNEGESFALIMARLRECGYTVESKIINACHFVPQNRKRLFILGVRGRTLAPWFGYSPRQDCSDLPLFFDGKKKKVRVKDCLEHNVDPCFMLSERAIAQAVKRQKERDAVRGRKRGGYKIINDLDCTPTLITDVFNGRILLAEERPSSYGFGGLMVANERDAVRGKKRGGYKIINDLDCTPTLITHVFNRRILLVEERPSSHGFGSLVIANEKDIAPTLLTNPDKSSLVVEQKHLWRRLTPREYSRLMGFDTPQGYDFVIPVSKTKAYEQFGNAVVPQVAESIAWHLTKLLSQEGRVS